MFGVLNARRRRICEPAVLFLKHGANTENRVTPRGNSRVPDLDQPQSARRVIILLELAYVDIMRIKWRERCPVGLSFCE